MTEAAMTPSTERDSRPAGVTGLSAWQFAGCLAILLSIFLLSGGPIWRHPWAMDTVNDAILWSYLPVPLLVLACLLFSRRLRWTAFVFDTLRLTFVKYSLTFAIALVLWTTTDQPARAATLAPRLPSPRPTVAATATAPPPAALPTGSVTGRAVWSDGRPAAGALVFLDPEVAVAASSDALPPLRLEYVRGGLTPRLTAVIVGQEVSVRSADGRMHTMIGETLDGAPIFNVPAIRSGAWSSVRIDEPHRRVTLRCSVHPAEGDTRAELVVLRHGVFTMADTDGRFTLAGVPEGEQQLYARLDTQEASVRVPVARDQAASADLSLPGPR